MTNLDTASIASLVLSTLLACPEIDGSLASEIARAVGVSPRQCRAALAQLVAAGLLVTSGRTRSTRYCVAGEPVSTQPAPVVAEMRRPRARRQAPAAPAPIDVVDLTAQLEATLALATPAAPLHSVRTEPAPLVLRLADERMLLAQLAMRDPFQIRVGES